MKAGKQGRNHRNQEGQGCNKRAQGPGHREDVAATEPGSIVATSALGPSSLTLGRGRISLRDCGKGRVSCTHMPCRRQQMCTLVDDREDVEAASSNHKHATEAEKRDVD